MTIPPSSAGEIEAADRPSLLGLSRSALAQALADLVDRPFRVDQIYRALHHDGVSRFEDISNLPKVLRQELDRRYSVGLPETATRQASADGTEKFLFELRDGATIETVDIPDGGRRTICLSSQAGCAMACKFCVTGFWGAGRNLTAGEIVGQVLALRRQRQLDSAGLNLVFMGMGEPLLNLPSVEQALAILTESISWRRITVSTVGILPGIEAMSLWPRRPNLAISLHAPDDERRSRIMPINKTYPLSDLVTALRRYPLEAGRKLTFEYLLIRGFNDQPRDADALVRRLQGLPAKINLIPINPDPVLGEGMMPPSPGDVERFRDRLRQRGWIATIRRRRGEDVSAACGQLRAFGREARGFRGAATVSY
ncbi:MAG TPA: 23S rRNA (adenine(2503)-C(2))-methyltransferase RlmN [Thermoanaerobaculia bacterium]|nr:23S rRNA (adenine(2503)-C(2))-methyltransferase RlmN [Thermoanaerobaculia bacterium]